jgi:hypothetical protein
LRCCQEFSRLEVLLRVQSGRLRVSDACALIGPQRRQVFRLLRGLKQDGATSPLSKHRGRPSNHRHHLRQQPPGEGTHRTGVWYAAGSNGQELALAKAGELPCRFQLKAAASSDLKAAAIPI